MDTGVFGDAWRSIIAAVDRAILNLVAALYDIMRQLATTQIFSEKSITDFAARIYTLLALIMVFKVTFSLITYLVNPDTISDSESGAGNLAKNGIIVLILIIVVPYGFDFLYRAQAAMLKDNFVAKLVYGGTDDTGPNGMNKIRMHSKCSPTNVTGTGQYLAMATLRPFFQINPSISANGTGGTDADHTIDAYCSAQSIDDIMVPEVYKKGTQDHITGVSGGVYVIDYSTLLSTITAFVVMILMLSTCLDIALRAVKLGFLELVAPIPIISYIDPKSGKNGMFKKWTDAVIATWASLFIKLAIVYFAIYTISLIADAFDDATKENSIWLILFLIIGALMFAKQAPKLIEDIFGIKLDGKMLHPIKKVQDDMLGGKAIATGVGMATGAAIGAIGGAAANAWAAKVNNQNAMKKLAEKHEDIAKHPGIKWSNLPEYQKIKYADEYKKAGGKTTFGNVRSIVAGSGSAAIRSAAAGKKSGKFTPIANANTGVTDSSTARTRRAGGYGFGTQFIDKVTDIAHIPQSYGTTSILKDEIKSLERENANLLTSLASLKKQYEKVMSPEKIAAHTKASELIWEIDGVRQKEPVFKYNDFASYKADIESVREYDAKKDLTESEFDLKRGLDMAVREVDANIAKNNKRINEINENMKPGKK